MKIQVTMQIEVPNGIVKDFYDTDRDGIPTFTAFRAVDTIIGAIEEEIHKKASDGLVNSELLRMTFYDDELFIGRE